MIRTYNVNILSAASLLCFLSFTCAAGADFKLMKEWAEGGNPHSQLVLGLSYQFGDVGVSIDYSRAVKWYRMAAEQGNAAAQCYLGGCYHSGLGVPQSGEEAVKYYRLSADQGNPDAQKFLGNCYIRGFGVNQDAKEGAKWYRMAAEQGKADAQALLGNCYQEGKGVSRDIAKALKWYRLAAEQGNSSAELSIGGCYKFGTGVSVDVKEAAKWFKKSAFHENEIAQFFLGNCYYFGEGVVEDYVEAYAWYIVSAMNGNKQGVKNKKILGSELNSAQVIAGQKRAKKLLAEIERQKVIAESDSDRLLASEIAPSGYGSGLLVKGGYVLTCWHVVDGVERISVSAAGKNHVAKVVQKDVANDIAILKVSEIVTGVVLNLSDDAKLGEKVFTLGYPHPDLQGSDVKFTTGSISSLTGIDNSPRYFQISAPLQSGNSGGPLFDEKGNLVGMVAAKLDSLATLQLTGDLPQNVNYAIKADYLEPVLKTIQRLEIGKAKTKDVNLLELIEELKQSAVMIKVY